MDISRPILKKLVGEINEFVVLVTESAGKRVPLIILEADSMIQVRPENITDLENLFMTGTGLVILSYKTEEEFLVINY